MNTVSANLKLVWKKYQSYLIAFGVIFIVVALNLGISALIRRSGIFFIPNTQPLGFSFGYYSSALILFLVTTVILEFKLVEKSPVNSILILSGIYSNFAENLIFSAVADYVNIFISYINLADIEIVIGLILLNITFWMKDKPNSNLPVVTNTPVED